MNGHQRHHKAGGKRVHSATAASLDEDGSPWQAMKRLRVHEGTLRHDEFRHQPQHANPPYQIPSHPHSRNYNVDHNAKQLEMQHYNTQQLHHHVQSAGQGTTSDETNENYVAVNHYLGQLHALRKDRELKMNASASNPAEMEANFSRTISPKRGAALTGDAPSSPHRKRKVIKLHTNSKLG